MITPDPAGLHIPVLLHEVLEHLRPVPGARFLDLTLGMGAPPQPSWLSNQL